MEIKQYNSATYPIKTFRKKWPIYGNRVMPGFVPDEISNVTLTFFSEFRADKWKSLQHTPNKGLLLAGPKGIGKTINFQIYSKMVVNDANLNRRIRIVSVLEIQEGYKMAQENGNGAKFLDDLANCPELVIDDIGNEDLNFKDYGTPRNLIADLLILRYQLFQRGMGVTHGTTNLKMESLEKIYDPRIIDRMKEMFCYYDLKKHYDRLGLTLESKRTEPIKEVQQVIQTEEPKLSEADKIRSYLNYYLKTIDEEVVPFYDKNNVMWAFLVNNQLINPIVLEDYDMKDKARKEADARYMNLTAGCSYVDIENLKRDYNQQAEEEKILKHMTMKRFFSEHPIDLSTFTDEQIMM